MLWTYYVQTLPSFILFIPQNNPISRWGNGGTEGSWRSHGWKGGELGKPRECSFSIWLSTAALDHSRMETSDVIIIIIIIV